MQQADSTAIVAQLAILVDELEKQIGKNEIETLPSQKIRNTVAGLNSADIGIEAAADIRTLAFRIWNLCIVALTNSAQTDDNNAFLRHAACDMLAIVQSRVSSTEDDLLTVIRFFGKTGSLWKDVHNYSLAKTCFQTAMEFWERTEKEFPAASTAATIKRNTIVFPIYCWRAEMAWEQKEKEMPYILVTRAKELVKHMPEEVFYLAMKCYNLALRYYNNKDMSEAIKWLEESHSIYSMDSNKDPQKQARTLKLLASAYVNVQNYSKAMSTISLANDETESPSGLYLAAKIQFLLGHVEHGTETVLRTVSNTECPFEVGIAACSLAIEHSATFSASRSLEILSTRHQLDPREFGQVLALQTTFFLSPKTQDLGRATAILDRILPSRLPRDSAQQIFTAIWRYVSTIFNKDPATSLEWFKRALSLTQSTSSLSSEDIALRSKCLRMIARCHLALSQNRDALDIATQAVGLTPELAASQFLMFKVHVALGDAAAATDVLHKLSACIDICPGFLEVCAQEANEAGHADIAGLALLCAMRQRIASGSSGTSEVGQLSVVLRCLVKLTMRGAQPEFRQLCEAMQLGVDGMNRFGASQMFLNSADELGWLVSVSWNQGLDCAKSGEYDCAHRLFKYTYEFSTQQALLTPGSHGTVLFNIVETQLVSLLLAAATALERGVPKQEEEARAGYQLVLGLIDRCNEVSHRLQDLGSDAAKRAKPLIILMEFKARALLKDPSLPQFLSHITAQSLPASVFESIAEVCMETNNATQLCMEALKTCMRLRSTEPTINYEKYSKIFRQLIVLADTKEAALAHYDEVGRILQGLGSGVWPTIELQWLFTTAWNNVCAATFHLQKLAQERGFYVFEVFQTARKKKNRIGFTEKKAQFLEIENTSLVRAVHTTKAPVWSSF